MSRSGPPDSALTALFIGLVATVALVDAALVVASPPPSLVESLRLLFAAGALGVPPLLLVLGVVLALVCVAAAVGVAGWRRTAFGRSQDRTRG